MILLLIILASMQTVFLFFTTWPPGPLAILFALGNFIVYVWAFCVKVDLDYQHTINTQLRDRHDELRRSNTTIPTGPPLSEDHDDTFFLPIEDPTNDIL